MRNECRWGGSSIAMRGSRDLDICTCYLLVLWLTTDATSRWLSCFLLMKLLPCWKKKNKFPWTNDLSIGIYKPNGSNKINEILGELNLVRSHCLIHFVDWREVDVSTFEHHIHICSESVFQPTKKKGISIFKQLLRPPHPCVSVWIVCERDCKN